jgi:drug/metabolite transporter (DMT)-like permease
MGLAQGVVFGIAALVGWGLADFFVALATRETSVLRTLVYGQAVSGVILTVVAVLWFEIPVISAGDAGLLLCISLLATVAYLAFYKGIQTGKLALVSPIAAAWAMITVALSIVLLGESLTPLQATGISLVIGGTILTAFQWHNLKELNWRNYETGVILALIAMLAWGVMFTLFDIAVAGMGWMLPVFSSKLILVGYLLLYGAVESKDLSLPTQNLLPVLAVGVFEAGATAAYGFGISIDLTSLVAPISAAFPAVTVVLARSVLDEDMDYNQWIGIAVIIAAVVLLSL